MPDDSMSDAMRQRAASFGDVAEDYDRTRPRYPAALFDDLLDDGARRVLDVGCGTGIAGAALLARGCDVLGVEPDARMAAVARAKGLAVEVSAFETWDPAGRRFDLLTCATAWHWVDPAAGLELAASCLAPGGTIALFWNVGTQDERTRAHLTEVYSREAPELTETDSIAVGRVDSDVWEKYAESVNAHGSFAPAAVSRYEWAETYSADEWISLIRTFSDHALLPNSQRTALLDGVRTAIHELGGRLEVAYTTVLVRAQRVMTLPT